MDYVRRDYLGTLPTGQGFLTAKILGKDKTGLNAGIYPAACCGCDAKCDPDWTSTGDHDCDVSIAGERRGLRG